MPQKELEKCSKIRRYIIPGIFIEKQSSQNVYINEENPEQQDVEEEQNREESIKFKNNK